MSGDALIGTVGASMPSFKGLVGFERA